MLRKKTEDGNDLFGTKAETLSRLRKLAYNVPPTYFFEVRQWKEHKNKILGEIVDCFKGHQIAVRSSTKAEDTADSSMAGAFESLLNIPANHDSLFTAINHVIASFDDNDSNQVLIQPMVENVSMSGVLMTQVLDDGSPYYVINYDDSSGLTDTVTSGKGINKTVYVYNGVNESDFDSPLLLALIKVTKKLQNTFPKIPLDIEFAIDFDAVVHILQVRKITTISNWKKEVIAKVSNRMVHLKQYVNELMGSRPYLYGNTTLLGFMPDWNPAEMIGVVPRPLALSLYRKLITQKTWRIAREQMGYREMPNVELMISLYGRVYIDVRNSINSFIPNGLEQNTADKIVNAYLARLSTNPHLHDKIEFEVVHTAYDFDFDKKFNLRYKNVLLDEEFIAYKSLLLNLTNKALSNDSNGSISNTLLDIEKLKRFQESWKLDDNLSTFRVADKINTLIDECVNLGTRPFSILARHGFIAEGLLRSAVSNGVLSKNRLQEFRRGIRTVASIMSEDFFNAITDPKLREYYLEKYGHLRPSSYDILSPNYANRENLFDGASKDFKHTQQAFVLYPNEEKTLCELLESHELNITPQALFKYCEEAIIGREYAKFIFTKHLSEILELAAQWGRLNGYSRESMSMLTIDDILIQLIAPFNHSSKDFYNRKIEKSRHNFDIASSFKLNYLIRSVRDVYIVPMQRSSPNFVGSKRLEAEVVHLTPYSESSISLEGKIVCIEGADPGYDWIFTRNILGLVTKYGGTNSHMAIRSAEYGIAAAIGCGEQPFNRIISAGRCLLDCQGKRLKPIEI